MRLILLLFERYFKGIWLHVNASFSAKTTPPNAKVAFFLSLSFLIRNGNFIVNRLVLSFIYLPRIDWVSHSSWVATEIEAEIKMEPSNFDRKKMTKEYENTLQHNKKITHASPQLFSHVWHKWEKKKIHYAVNINIECVRWIHILGHSLSLRGVLKHAFFSCRQQIKWMLLATTFRELSDGDLLTSIFI